MIVAAGGKVAILDRDTEHQADIIAKLGRESSKYFYTDVGISSSIADSVLGVIDWIKETKAELGGIIAAAGIGIATPCIDNEGRSCDITSFERVMKVNVTGSIDLACQFLPYWTKLEGGYHDGTEDGDRGAIIFVSSIVAFEAQVGMSAYAASKAAVSALILPMTRELAPHRIRVVAIAPGVFDTPMSANLPPAVAAIYATCVQFPKRTGDRSEFGKLSLHILENVYLNGTTIRLDGGKSYCIDEFSLVESRRLCALTNKLIASRYEDASPGRILEQNCHIMHGCLVTM